MRSLWHWSLLWLPVHCGSIASCNISTICSGRLRARAIALNVSTIPYTSLTMHRPVVVRGTQHSTIRAVLAVKFL